MRVLISALAVAGLLAACASTDTNVSEAAFPASTASVTPVPAYASPPPAVAAAYETAATYRPPS